MQSDRHRRGSVNLSRRPGETQTYADLTEAAFTQKSKKRRISGDRAALRVTREEAYFQAPSLGGGTRVPAMLNGGKSRIDRQVVYPTAKQNAKAASAACWGGYGEWRKSACLEVFTITGTVASITLDRDDQGEEAPLSPGSVVRHRHAIHYLSGFLKHPRGLCTP